MIRSQKRIPGLIGLIVAVLLMAVVIKLPVRAAADDYSGSNWMSGLDDSRYLYEINLPGTNNSGFQSVVGWYNNTEDKRYPGADSGAAFILTQNQGVYEQLKSGVRFLDLGLSDIGPEERSDQLIVTSTVTSGSSSITYFAGESSSTSAGALTLDRVIERIRDFLGDETSSKETIVLYLRQDGGNRDNVISLLNKKLTELAGNYLYLENGSSAALTAVPTLGSSRGKIVILSGFTDAKGANQLSAGLAFNMDGSAPKAGGTAFASETEDGISSDQKLSRLNSFISGNREEISSSAESHLAKGKFIITSTHTAQGSSNAETPKDASNVINPALFTGTAEEPALLADNGTHYGWFLSDYVNDTTAKAVWKANFHSYYTVSFNTASGSAVESQTVVKNGTAVQPAPPVRNGFTFDGWYADQNLAQVYNFSTPVTKDTVIYAGWQKNYTVIFNSNYAAGSTTSVSVTPGTAVAQPADPVREGFGFGGWYADSSLTQPYDFSKAVEADMNLFAAWKCTVSFDTGGGTEITAQTVNYNGRLEEPAAPQKAGLSFAGWYTNPTLSQSFSFTTLVKKSMTLYARWTAAITFGANGGTGTMRPVTVNEGTMYSLPSCNFTPPRGYTFDRWDLGTPGTKVEITGAVSITAQWKARSSGSGGSGTDYSASFTVSFVSNGGSDIASQTVSYGQSISGNADPVRQGYRFDGWYTDAALTNPYDLRSPVTSNLTLFAKWSSSDQVAVSFDANGGTGTMNSVYVDINSDYVLPGCSFTAPGGKSFYSWDRGMAGTTVRVTESMTLYARWQDTPEPQTLDGDQVIPECILTYETNGGTEMDPQIVLQGLIPRQPADPEKSGYLFDGWYVDSSFETPFFFSEGLTESRTIYAKWVLGNAERTAAVYTVAEGANEVWLKGSKTDAVLTVNRSRDNESCFERFLNVQIDGKLLEKGTDYTAEAGSTVVWLKADFLEDLEEGEHRVVINFHDGKAETTLTIRLNEREDAEAPVTGDEKRPRIWLMSLLFSGFLLLVTGMGLTVVKCRKTKKEG